jgi:predicted RNase H-like HicB family nuclease
VKTVKNLFGNRTKDGGVVAFLELTSVVWPEEDQWVSQCVELDVASSGSTPDEAQEQLMDALCAYLNTLEELGEREQVLEERGIEVYTAPKTGNFHPTVPRSYLRHAGAQIRPVEVPFPRLLVPA